jgi:cytochrome o ubiquinol oxidase subunit 2
MSQINKKRVSTGWLVCIILFGLTDLGLILRKLMIGHNVALFNPRGVIAQQQYSLIIRSAVILLALLIPTLFLLYFIAWKYRETNIKATYRPNKRGGKLFNFSAWAVPTACMLVLASIMWPATHKLDPRKSITAGTKPLEIQVISMRWKWLFIYPEQGIATINYVQVPVGRPVQFELTADEAPMSSFWIPNLGGQLYSMTGMVNRLNLMADTPGDYPGSTAEINGAGFSGMKFIARASDTEAFDRWVQNVKMSPDVLNTSEYASVLKPSENNQVALYSNYDGSIYDKVVMKYMGPEGSHMHHK